MIRPALAALTLVLLLVPALPARAEEADEDPRPAPTLAELTRRAEAELRLLAGDHSLLAPGDFAALRRARLNRLDLTIGALRDEAAYSLQMMLPDAAVGALAGVGDNSGLAGITAALTTADLTPVQLWLADSLSADWLELHAALERLRAFSATGPERVCPVSTDNWFVDDWGADRPWGRRHKGTDVHGGFGVPVVAVEDGVVVQANWHRAGGRQIYIRADSTGDVFYYAHLEYWEKWIWTGTRVEAGDVIGLLGESGNADSPHLHFGWMPGSGDVDLANLQNPYPLLLEVCR